MSSCAPRTVVPQVSATITGSPRSGSSAAASASRSIAPSGVQSTGVASIRRMRAAFGIE